MPFKAYAEDFDVYFSNETDKSYDYKLWERNGRFEQKILDVGFKILNANKVKNRVAFNVYDVKNYINAFAIWPSSRVVILKQMFPYIDNDDELAALLAHEITHIQQNDRTGTFFLKCIDVFGFSSKHYEHDADIKGVDLMVKAGYNPLAMITFLNKISPEDHWIIQKLDYIFWIRSHPTGTKRLEKIYNHILANYPQFIMQGYKSPYYENFLINVEKNPDIQQIKEKNKL